MVIGLEIALVAFNYNLFNIDAVPDITAFTNPLNFGINQYLLIDGIYLLLLVKLRLDYGGLDLLVLFLVDLLQIGGAGLVQHIDASLADSRSRKLVIAREKVCFNDVTGQVTLKGLLNCSDDIVGG